MSEVENEIFDLFCTLEANDEQLEYPLIYASARNGWAINDLDKNKEGVNDLLQAVIDNVPHPKVDIGNLSIHWFANLSTFIDGDVKMLIS